MKTIGEFIAERRKALGLSQKELAALIKAHPRIRSRTLMGGAP
jgi:transcriptional regulator with XRE-family HTH domain